MGCRCPRNRELDMASPQQSIRPVFRSRRRTRSAVAAKARIPLQPRLPAPLEALFAVVSEPVLKLEVSPNGEATLGNIGILIGDVLDLLEEDQTILLAADRLYEASLELQEARDKRATCAKTARCTLGARVGALHVALAGFRASLWSAKPNARGRAWKVGWSSSL